MSASRGSVQRGFLLRIFAHRWMGLIVVWPWLIAAQVSMVLDDHSASIFQLWLLIASVVVLILALANEIASWK